MKPSDHLRAILLTVLIFCLFLFMQGCNTPMKYVLNASGDTCYPCRRNYTMVGDSCVYDVKPSKIY